MSPRLPSLNGRPIGFAKPLELTPESTDPTHAVETVLQLGATGVECPVRLTADGVPVLHPSARVGPRLRRRALTQLTADRLPDEVLRLAQLYGRIGPRVQVLLEVEDPAAFGPILELARDVGPGTEANLWLSHPDMAQLTDWRPRTSAVLLNSIRLGARSGGLERRAAELEQRGLDGLKQLHRDWSGGRVTLLHRFGLLAVATDPRYPREVAEVVDAGIDGICSAHVEPMMAVIGEYYPAPPPSEDR